MLVDIIVRAKDGHDLTRACLDSVFFNTPQSSFRLILVDDGSSPPFEGHSDVLLRCAESSGAVTATNFGLAVALQGPAPHVMVMDNDAEVPEGDRGWLARFVSELEQAGPGCAAVGATSDRVSGHQQILACPQTYTGQWDDGKNRAGTAANPPITKFVSFCVLLRKDAVRRVGLWDTRYDPGNWEDTDYAIQLRQAGYDVRVARSVYLHHRCHATFGADLGKLMEVNQTKFVAKWGVGLLWDMGIIPPDVVSRLTRSFE